MPEIRVMTWSWDCDNTRDTVWSAAYFAANRIYAAHMMLLGMIHYYNTGAAQGRAWARAMWDYGGTGSAKYWIGDFSEFRLLLGVRTLEKALSKITYDLWLFLCYEDHCVNGDDKSAYTTPGRITLCPGFFGLSPTEQGGTVLHELLHVCNELWLHRIMTDVERCPQFPFPDDKCYHAAASLFLRINPDIRESVYDQENHVTLSTAASVLNTDNLGSWLEARFEKYGCGWHPSGFPNLHEF